MKNYCYIAIYNKNNTLVLKQLPTKRIVKNSGKIATTVSAKNPIAAQIAPHI
jgi:hypothetical protein